MFFWNIHTLVALVEGIFKRQIIILKLESKEHCEPIKKKTKVSTLLNTSSASYIFSKQIYVRKNIWNISAFLQVSMLYIHVGEKKKKEFLALKNLIKSFIKQLNN